MCSIPIPVDVGLVLPGQGGLVGGGGGRGDHDLHEEKDKSCRSSHDKAMDRLAISHLHMRRVISTIPLSLPLVVIFVD